MVGVGGFQNLDDCLFGCMIDFGNEIIVLLFRDFDAVDVKRGAIDDRSAAASGLHRSIKHGMHRGSVKMAAPTRRVRNRIMN